MLWPLAILLSLSMTAASLVISQFDDEDWRQAGSSYRVVVAAVVVLTVIIAAGLVFAPVVLMVWLSGLIILGLLVALITAFTSSTASSRRQWATMSVAGSSVAVALIAVVMFDVRPAFGTDDVSTGILYGGLEVDLLIIGGLMLGIMAMVITWPDQRFHRAVGAALLVMTALNVVNFALWLNAGAPEVLAKSGAVAMTLIVALVLNRYMRRQTVDSDDVPCLRCQQSNHRLTDCCQHCGFPLNQDARTGYNQDAVTRYSRRHVPDSSERGTTQAKGRRTTASGQVLCSNCELPNHPLAQECHTCGLPLGQNPETN